MAQLQKNQVHTVTVTGYTAEGLGVARAEGQVVFIHGGVRGEVCAVRILKVLKNVAYGRVEEILTRSPPAGAGLPPLPRLRRLRLPAYLL